MIDFPEPLFEAQLHQTKLCLACARRPAATVLRSSSREIVPIFEDCSKDWNIHGYQILRRIKPARLVQRIVKFKLMHPFQRPSLRTIWRDVNGLKEWAGKMRKWMK